MDGGERKCGWWKEKIERMMGTEDEDGGERRI